MIYKKKIHSRMKHAMNNLKFDIAHFGPIQFKRTATTEKIH